MTPMPHPDVAFDRNAYNFRKGEFCPGEPYLFFKDLNDYEVEIAFELPTPVDPKPAK